MPFEAKKQVFNASIGTLDIGSDTTVQLGGENVWPLYTFDGALANPPRVGIEVSDLGTENWDDSLKAYYSDCADVPAIAAKACAVPGAEYLYLKFDSADPNGQDKDVAECAALAKDVAAKATLPIAIGGCGTAEKDSALFTAVAEALEGKNVLFLSATEDNYKAVGTGVALAWNQKVADESAVDINLAKQLNIMMNQIGVSNDMLAMNAGSAAAGYGFEYLSSTLERIKAAALSQNDVALQVPIVTPVGGDAWGTKEAVASEADFPQWGGTEARGIHMEIVTASASLASGTNSVIMRHPEAVSQISTFIGQLTEGGE